jgi:CRISPR-associated exonuclease Cas4
MEIAIGLGVLALLLLWLALRMRGQSALPEGRVVYDDTGAWARNERAFFSKAHRLSGKPDYLIETQAGIVPVELKSGQAPARPRDGHVLQLAAYCLLIEEAYASPPPEGLIKYEDDYFVIAYTPALRERLLRTLAVMRADLEAGGNARNHREPGRCRSCGVRDACDESLAP